MRMIPAILAALALTTGCQTTKKASSSDNKEPVNSKLQLGDSTGDGNSSPEDQFNAIKECVDEGLLHLVDWGISDGSVEDQWTCVEIIGSVRYGSGDWLGLNDCLSNRCIYFTKYRPCFDMKSGVMGICDTATGKVVQWATPGQENFDPNAECYWDRANWHSPPIIINNIAGAVIEIEAMVDPHPGCFAEGPSSGDPSYCTDYVDGTGDRECSDGTDGSGAEGSGSSGGGSMMLP